MKNLNPLPHFSKSLCFRRLFATGIIAVSMLCLLALAFPSKVGNAVMKNSGIRQLEEKSVSTEALIKNVPSLQNKTEGINSWTSNGPYGGDISSLVIDPSNPSILYAGTAFGVFKSINRGASWDPVNNGLSSLGVTALVIDPSNPVTVYAATLDGGGVFKTANGGTNWNPINTGLTDIYISSLIIDPKNPSTLFAGSRSGVFKSTNAGVNWAPINTGLTNTQIQLLVIDLNNPSIVYAGTFSSGVFKSTNGGATWNPINTGLTATYIRALVIDPSNPSILYAGSLDSGSGTIFKSSNGGVNWSRVNSGLSTSVLVIDLSNPNTVYAGTLDEGLFKSTNGGTIWNQISTGLVNTHVKTITLDPSNPVNMFAGTQGGVFYSSNSGGSWSQINNGLKSTSIGMLAVAPSDPSMVYAGTVEDGVFKSTDGGGSWNRTGLTNIKIPALAIDPSNPNIIYAGTNRNGGIFKSTDGGASWIQTKSNPVNVDIHVIVIDPQNPRTVYAGTQGNGVLKSINSGASWSQINTGLMLPAFSTYANVLAIDPVTPSTLFVGVGEVLFKSTNGGASWNQTSQPSYTLRALVIDPKNPNNIYVGTYDGVFKSVNGGGSWSKVWSDPTSLQSIAWSLAIDANNSSIVYAGTDRKGVIRSTDGGVSWSSFNAGLLGTTIYSLAIDSSGRSLHAGTNSGGVFDYSYTSSVIPTLTKASQLSITPNQDKVRFNLTAQFDGDGFDVSNVEVVVTNGPGCTTTDNCVVPNNVLSNKTSKQFVAPLTLLPGTYDIAVRNSSKGTLSNKVSFTVCIAPAIKAQPQSTTTNDKGIATLSVTATGDAPLTYRWYEGAKDVTSKPVGTNSNSFTTPVLTKSTSYWVKVSNRCDSVNSDAAYITASSAVGKDGTITMFPSQSYKANTLLLSAIATDTRYGIVKSGSVSWELQDRNGVSQSNGQLVPINGSWNGLKVFFQQLNPGKYKIYYKITSDRGRTGSAIGELQVPGKEFQNTITGTVRDSADGKPLPGSNVTLFDGNGLWQLIRQSYSGVIPTLQILTARLPVIRSATSDSNGRYSLNDIPPGSYSIIAGNESYIPGGGGSVVIAADTHTISRDIHLDSNSSLAVLKANVNGLFSACQNALDHNAEIMGQMTSRVQSDDIYGNGDGLDKFSKIASEISFAGGITSTGIEQLPNFVGKVDSRIFEEAIRKVAVEALKKGTIKLEKEVFKNLNNRIKNDLIKKEFPLEKSDFQASEYHTVFINQIAQIRTNFNNQAGSVPLNSEFEIEKAKQILGGISTNLNDASSGKVVFLASPLSTEGIGMLKLDTMKRNYDILSNQQKLAKISESVLSTVQIAGTAVTIAGSLSIVGAPVAGVAHTAKEAAGVGKFIVQQVRIVLKTQMGFVFIDALVGTYPEDNGLVVQEFDDSINFLKGEASTPYYLKRGNIFNASTDVNLNLTTYKNKPIMYTLGIPYIDIGQKVATIKVKNTGNVASKFRVLGNGVWSPITLLGELGLGEKDFLTSREIVGPFDLNSGGSTSIDLPYRGFSRNFLSTFKPHYLTIETYSGPWHMTPLVKPYYVVGLGTSLAGLPFLSPTENNQAAAPILEKITRKENYLSTTASAQGQLQTSQLLEQVAAAGELGTATLSPITPKMTASFTPEADLFAADLRLFLPQEGDVAIKITDNEGRHFGYSVTDGITFNELPGVIADLKARPISVRLFSPVAGSAYQVEVALLSPGLQDVPVTLFYEPVKNSPALMTAFPSSIVIDGDRGAILDLTAGIAESSQQQALTDVTASVGTLSRFKGAETLQVNNQTSNDLEVIPAGEQRNISWQVAYPTDAARGKYTGTLTISSHETASLMIPVVALVREKKDIVSFFEGPSANNPIVQKSLQLGVNGKAQTWVNIPNGFRVVHATMGVAADSANLSNPSLDIGKDGINEWAFSGKFDIGVKVDHLEDIFNAYIKSNAPGQNGWDVPIEAKGPEGEKILLNGIQLFLDKADAATEFEADVSPRPTGKRSGTISISDWVQVGRFAAGLDTPEIGSEFQRSDCAPRNTFGDGRITVADWVQAGRYAVGLDPVASAGGAFAPVTIAPSTPTSSTPREVKAISTQWQRGKINTIQIAMDAKGDENGLAFSLNYDPKIMTFLDASLGDGATGASLQVNTTKAVDGLVGIVVILPAGQQFVVGTRNLVTLQFIPNGGDGITNTVVSFSDQSITRELVDTNASPIGGVTYTGANLTITGKAVAMVSAANYVGGEQAAESIVSAFGTQLAWITLAAPSLPLPISLGSSQVVVKDSKGVERFAPLFYVSPSQINFQIPTGTAEGVATLTFINGVPTSQTGLMMIGRVVPAMFSADATGVGLAAGSALTVRADGARTENNLARYDVATSKFIAQPIDVGSSGDQVYLTLYGTGIKNRNDLANVKVKIGGIDAPVEYAGAQGFFAGLDQINVRVPQGLSGRGEVLVEMSVEGKATNLVKIVLK